MTNISDTIDVEDFANYVKDSLVKYGTDLVWAEIIAAAPWAAPLSWMLMPFIKWIVTKLATQGGQVAFMINTGVFTQDQAKDYMTAIEKIHTLPDDVPDDDWEKAENEANHAFKNLIRFAA